MAQDNEFFVLVPEYFTFAKEDTEIPETKIFTPDVVAPVSSVSAASNTNPITITTTAAHGLRTGMIVYVGDIGGNTAANGQWLPVTVTSTTQFTVPVAGNGAYTSGGTITPNETAIGTPDLIGAAYNERDMLAINTGVVIPPTLNCPPSPASVSAGSADFTITVNGSHFTTAAQIRFNSTLLSTSYVASTQLTATVPAALVATALAVCITVQDVGGISNSCNFLVSGGSVKRGYAY